jgi:hypothetical protein
MSVCVCVLAFVRASVCGCLGLCVCVAMLIQHATRMRHVVTSFVASLAPAHFLLCLINGTIFGKKSLNIKCVF